MEQNGKSKHTMYLQKNIEKVSEKIYNRCKFCECPSEGRALRGTNIVQAISTVYERRNKHDMIYV